MGSRLELQTLLEAVLGSKNVYFQPPETIKIKYPAIIYHLAAIRTDRADGINYRKGRNYTITLIHNDPDNSIVDSIIDLPYCAFDRCYISDNLYHYVFEIFY